MIQEVVLNLELVNLSYIVTISWFFNNPLSEKMDILICSCEKACTWACKIESSSMSLMKAYLIYCESGRMSSMPIHILQYVIHAQKRPCTHISLGTYEQKQTVILCMHNQ